MTKKQMLFKRIFLIFMCVLSLAMAIHNFVYTDYTYIPYSGDYISHRYYNGDAYTGIQNAIADAGNNVYQVSSTVSDAGREIMDAMLLAFAFIFTIVFFVFLYLTIKAFMETAIEEAKEVVKEVANDDASKIEYYNSLKERGLLSKEEFELKKKQLLGI